MFSLQPRSARTLCTSCKGSTAQLQFWTRRLRLLVALWTRQGHTLTTTATLCIATSEVTVSLEKCLGLGGLNETIMACGENRAQLPVYRIAAENLEQAFDELLGKGIHRFALLLKPGTALLTKPLTIGVGSSALEIVVAAEHSQDVTTMAPTAAELTTRVNLAKHQIFISAAFGNPVPVPGFPAASVCFQDLRIYNGQVKPSPHCHPALMMLYFAEPAWRCSSRAWSSTGITGQASCPGSAMRF